MIQQYGGSCLSERKVYQKVERFQEGQTSMTDEHRSGHPCTTVSDANVAHMDAFIGENRWVLRQVTDEHKLKNVLSFRAFMTCYHAEGEEFLVHTFMGDETWVHYYEPESKRQSMEWQHTSSPSKKKFKLVPSARKLMLTLFWDMDGPTLEYYQEKGQSVNSLRYSTMLEEKTEACNSQSLSQTSVRRHPPSPA
ncbi:histone-lysine N-methyltransferase SETMAR-like [Cryptotermes secundus]|uniref:histone-lysine N-methyltransferase SETMAR-like n=1 Tax=Cryptotermes secundus TaxID=105785 RepID=UPI000CD7BBDF|nr:histone-lysine N-methyltransferase SETMAR-like [Cryptotermes secundus]